VIEVVKGSGTFRCRICGGLVVKVKKRYRCISCGRYTKRPAFQEVILRLRG
jgi:rubrerythrin